MMSGPYINRSGAWFLLFFSLLPATLLGQALPSVRAQTDSAIILIGDQFHLVLQAELDSGSGTLVWAAVPDSFNHLLVVRRGPVDTSRVQGRLHFSQVITLTGFDSGYWQIPTFTFGLLPGGGDSTVRFFQTDSTYIAVQTVPVDTTKPFMPIKTVRGVSLSWRDYLGYILIGAGILVMIGILLYFLLRTRKRSAPPGKEAPREPPDQFALRRLAELEQDQAWNKLGAKEYYTEVTAILREYIERQFQVPALELSTDDLLAGIRPITVLSQKKEKLRSVLSTADLVKFAKVVPGSTEGFRVLDDSREIILWSRPKTQEEEGTEGSQK